MITFTDSMDSRCYEVKPQVARFKLHRDKNLIVYCVVGTDYGYIHTSAGDVRIWRSYSGARRFLREYLKSRL